MRRHKKLVKQSVQNSISERSITDTHNGSDISIPKRNLSEPVFHHGQGGDRQNVHPGNKEFQSGDRFQRPSGGHSGTGEGDASNSGEGTDDFIFHINRDEYLQYIFEDLELPNLVRKELSDSSDFKLKRAGFTTAGAPDRLNVVRSLKAAHARRIALSGSSRREIRTLKRELRELEVHPEEAEPKKLEELREQILLLNKKLRKLPFIDDFDLRYNNLVKIPQPSSKAVMFCLMDVSGSMSQNIKDIAKRFFLLLYLFLERNYEELDVVFIRHHTEARECDEHDFFYAKETGGTIVSSALQLSSKIISDRYPPNSWNIYIAQASDGDNWGSDNDKCFDVITQQLLPQTQFYAYVEIADRPQNLWYTYKQIEKSYPELFAQQKIRSRVDIYPVFRRLFEKREVQNA